MSWDSIVGQKRVKRILQKTLKSRRLPHAYLFHGPDGVGKDAVALELAKITNCERGDLDACDECDSCRRFVTLQHPNLTLVFSLPIGSGEKSGDDPLSKLGPEDLENVREQIRFKAENPYHRISVPRATAIKVNSIRSIKREASLTKYRSGRKAIIIFDAEHMNLEASNALLKTLEEPNDDTLLILTTSYRDQLTPTVLSRCQSIRFDVLTEVEISGHLEHRLQVDRSRAELVGRLAHGSICRALDLLDVDLQNQRDEAVSFLRTVYNKSTVDIAKFIERLSRQYDRNELQRFLQLLQFWVRDALCIAEGHPSVINADKRDALERFVSLVPRSSFPILLEKLDTSVSLIGRNVYIPLVLTDLALAIKRAVSQSAP